MSEYDLREIERLEAGQLPWPRVQEIMKAPKDPDRFDKWLQIMQGRVPWSERIVKCRCGQEFGDYRVNWKLSALIYVRESAEALQDIYHGREQPDPAWVQLREYYCPGCGSQLEVEAVPRGCPPDFEFLPDLDTFYEQWLGRPLANKQEFADGTLDAVREWSA